MGEISELLEARKTYDKAIIAYEQAIAVERRATEMFEEVRDGYSRIKAVHRRNSRILNYWIVMLVIQIAVIVVGITVFAQR